MDEQELHPEDEPTSVESGAARAEQHDDLLNIEESYSATRLSPYGIAALAVSVVGLWGTAQSFLFSPTFFSPPIFGPLWRQIVFGLLPSALPLFAMAGLAFWLAGRAENEILIADGSLGGVGFYRAARAITAVLVAIVFAAGVLRVLGSDFPEDFPEPPVPAEVIEDGEDLEFLPPPAGSAP
ncbi:MAG: hypothetical protein ACRDKJ_01455 [Actinomycetota bacterium]